MSTRYYLKEVVSRPLRTKSGITVPWNDAGDDVGWIATNDPRLINELDIAAARRIGGVRVATLEQVEEAKKKANARQHFFERNGQRWNGAPRIDPTTVAFPAKAAASGEDPARMFDPSIPEQSPSKPEVGQPLEIPSDVPRPRRGRAPRPAAETASGNPSPSPDTAT